MDENHPCAELYREVWQAMVKWRQSQQTGEMSSPLETVEEAPDFAPFTTDQQKGYEKAREDEKDAYKEFLAKQNEYLDCMKKNKSIR